jgi:hypothetical protein
VPLFGVTDADGTELTGDQAYGDCGAVNALQQALTLAGADLTHETLYDAFIALGDVELAGVSDGKGSFRPGKPFAATAVHTVRLVPGDPDAVRDENGFYRNCLIPRNCFQVVTPDVWTPITATVED